MAVTEYQRHQLFLWFEERDGPGACGHHDRADATHQVRRARRPSRTSPSSRCRSPRASSPGSSPARPPWSPRRRPCSSRSADPHREVSTTPRGRVASLPGSGGAASLRPWHQGRACSPAGPCGAGDGRCSGWRWSWPSAAARRSPPPWPPTARITPTATTCTTPPSATSSSTPASAPRRSTRPSAASTGWRRCASTPSSWPPWSVDRAHPDRRRRRGGQPGCRCADRWTAATSTSTVPRSARDGCPPASGEVFVSSDYHAELERILDRPLAVGDHIDVGFFWGGLLDGEVDPNTVVEPLGVESLRISGFGLLPNEVLPEELFPRQQIIVSRTSRLATRASSPSATPPPSTRSSAR